MIIILQQNTFAMMVLLSFAEIRNFGVSIHEGSKGKN